MKAFGINIYEGHCLLKDGNNIILVDTGAPKTIHVSNNFTSLGASYLTTTNQRNSPKMQSPRLFQTNWPNVLAILL